MATCSEATAPNAEQSKYWTSAPGRKWIELQEPLDTTFAPVSAVLLTRAAPRAGEQVLDLGCGAGATSIALAERVGGGGRVVAVDISAPLLAHAIARTPHHLASRIDYLEADAQTHAFPAGRFDLLVSRFGAMFFADPVAAFRNLRAALRPGGRLLLAAWGPGEANPWFTIPRDAAIARLGRPTPVPPEAPGPLAFADAERVLRILHAAGFAAPEAESVRVDLEPPGTIDSVARLMSYLGPSARIIAEFGGDAEDVAAICEATAAGLRPYGADARVRVPAVINLFAAAAPRASGP